MEFICPTFSYPRNEMKLLLRLVFNGFSLLETSTTSTKVYNTQNVLVPLGQRSKPL